VSPSRCVRTVNHLQDTEEISARLRDAASLGDLLAASFDAFEIARMLARAGDHAPGLFAAFMTAADAAVDGREAVTAAPALPAGGTAACALTPAGAGTEEITAALAALGTLLTDRLAYAVTLTAEPADRDACAAAADAASRIHHLMAR